MRRGEKSREEMRRKKSVISTTERPSCELGKKWREDQLGDGAWIPQLGRVDEQDERVQTIALPSLVLNEILLVENVVDLINELPLQA